MTDIPSIAKGLTEAQRDFLLFLPADGGWKQTSERDFNRHGVNALRGFGKSGMIEGDYGTFHMRHRLTPLGLALREYLENERGGE